MQHKIEGAAAIAAAATFVVGFWLYFTLLIPAKYGVLSIDPIQHVAFLIEHKTTMSLWNLVIYVAFGMVLTIVVLALQRRLQARAPALIRTATAFGLIWAGLVIASGMVANIGADVVTRLYETDPTRAAQTWLAMLMIVNGLGGGNEIVGGLWLLLASVAGLRAGGLPWALNLFGAVISAAGLLTTIPPLQDLGAAFGLGLIVWFLWLGVVLIRDKQAGAGCPWWASASSSPEDAISTART
jgi:hypothetical protein